MLTKSTRTFGGKGFKREWFVVDAKDRTLGRLAVKVADVLQGKHKPTFTQNEDAGDFVVVINAGQVKLTGKKWTDKVYHHYSGYPGGLKSFTAQKLRERHPDQLVYLAVQGMLPKGPLGYKMLRKLKVYSSAEHPHKAQAPKALDI
ncbi:MAG: 50S ribosomal protein L13 [Deltaproteobacteria bacterium]|nr:50S ribosomal protein L13 [Deltaproteobacteria bacterium]